MIYDLIENVKRLFGAFYEFIMSLLKWKDDELAEVSEKLSAVTPTKEETTATK